MHNLPINPMTDALTLATTLGEPGSGRVRYGAAMALYQNGAMSAEQLEVFRIASADDGLDAGRLLAEHGLPQIDIAAPSAETLLRVLVDAIDLYLAGLQTPGIDEARQGIARFRDGAYVLQNASSNAVVAAHLQAALAANDRPALGALIAAASPLLSWITYDLYDRREIGEVFATSHVFCSIIGGAGPIRSEDFDLGLFLIAPNVLYRDHCHAAPELYAPLTGPHGWRFKPGAPLVIKEAHDPVWNEPNRPHLTKVGQVPFLCIYCWTRDTEKPARVLPATDWAELEALKL